MKALRLVGPLLLLTAVVAGCGLFKPTPSSNTAANSANATPSPSSTPMSGVGKVDLPAPETVIEALYKAHDVQKSPFFQSKDRALVDRFFSKPLADLIWKDATAHPSDVGAIDADPLYDGQDLEVKDFKFGKAQIDGDKATVIVTFSNFGEPRSVKFLMSAGPESWKVDDIVYTRGDSLLKWLKDANKPSSSAPTGVIGEFEGKYKVGETTCTVKPVKMAFEVRWAKGKGVETFFSKNSVTFESSPPDSGPNQFVFDDENYNTGIFYRTDGKTFEVKRIQ